MVEGARLESVYGFIAHRGFESLSLRHSVYVDELVTSWVSKGFHLTPIGFDTFFTKVRHPFLFLPRVANPSKITNALINLLVKMLIAQAP